MFLLADDFLMNVLFFRNVWLRGRLGGGKTLLAVALADYLINTSHDFCYCVANFPVRLPAPPDRTLFDTVVIFDEAWAVIDSRDFQRNAREYGAYARKFRSVWLYPSVHPPDVRVRTLYAERIFRFEYLPFGLWVYKWAVNLGYVSEDGYFALVRPEAYFSMYDTDFVPDADGGISVFWRNTLAVIRQRQGQSRSQVKGVNDDGS